MKPLAPSRIPWLATLAFLWILCLPLGANASRSVPFQTADGEVHLPLELYQQLLQAAQTDDPTAPSRFALSSATVRASVRSGADGSATASVKATFAVEVFEDGWTLIPILPAGTALKEVTVDGTSVQLIAGPSGLSWIANRTGSFTLEVHYVTDAVNIAESKLLTLPLPLCPSSTVEAELPGTGWHVTVAPGTGVQTEAQGSNTLVRATVPQSANTVINWGSPNATSASIGKASYSGELIHDSVHWTANFFVNVRGRGEARIPFLSTGSTLMSLSVNGVEAMAQVEGRFFSTNLSGEGTHEITAQFNTPLNDRDGNPGTYLQTVAVPVSQFELRLPGTKEVMVQPHASVQTSVDEDGTVARAFVPLNREVFFSWEEAVPESVQTEMQANASLYHLAHAEEGVLHMRAIVFYEITRGETTVLEFNAPSDIQIHSIQSGSGSVKDWRWGEQGSGPGPVSVFFDRPVTGNQVLEVHYERLYGTSDGSDNSIPLPLLGAADVHRQRGMVALLSGPDLALNPVDEAGSTKVGENQLPPYVRDRVKRTIGHTYKYFHSPPTLVVKAEEPERKAGKFDAQVDTLLSLGEVALKGSASLEVNVKSGSIMDLEMDMPEGVNILGLTGPSIRTHEIKVDRGTQKIRVDFTREMEGLFRLELQYERILSDGEGDSSTTEVDIPTVRVRGAEVEHGRLAVEALTAVEVRALTASHLTSLDINELPQQLILKTTNPILLAFKYVYADPAWDLVLQITRHQELEVQEAVIERAEYRSLFTRDGLAVTRAEYFVRNSRKQFLRVDLPEGSKVWSVFVAGRAEKPATSQIRDGMEGGSDGILIKLINSTEGFPVEIVYSTPVQKIGSFGKIAGKLPRPQMVVTQTRWDVYLPGGIEYRRPRTNMDLVIEGGIVDAKSMQERADALRKHQGANIPMGPLPIRVPARGVHLSFDKLYAGQAEEDARFEVRYAAVPGWVPPSLGGTAAMLLWLIPLTVLLMGKRLSGTLWVLTAFLGVVLFGMTVSVFGNGLWAAGLVSALCLGLAAVGGFLKSRRPALPEDGPLS